MIHTSTDYPLPGAVPGSTYGRMLLVQVVVAVILKNLNIIDLPLLVMTIIVK